MPSTAYVALPPLPTAVHCLPQSIKLQSNDGEIIPVDVEIAKHHQDHAGGFRHGQGG